MMSESRLSCHDMRMGEVYACGDCGLELRVVKECKEAAKPAEECEHCAQDAFACCGHPMTRKSTSA